MFERDKEELRSLGVPIEVGNLDAYFDDEPGYRIRPDEFALPEISLTADEAAVLGLAVKVWEHARLAEATTEAVRKLAAAGLPVDESALDVVSPRLAVDEPAFDLLWEAILERTPVAFEYHRTGAAGRDPPPPALGRGALLRALVRRRPRHRPRCRAGLPALPGRGIAASGRRTRAPTTCPPGTDVRAVARTGSPRPLAEPAVVLVRQGTALGLRRKADVVETARRGTGRHPPAGTGCT